MIDRIQFSTGAAVGNSVSERGERLLVPLRLGRQETPPWGDMDRARRA